MIRFWFARARREAQLLSVPLFWIRVADDSNGLDALPQEEQGSVLKALLRHWSVHGAAYLHTIMPAYTGERVRLAKEISAYRHLGQEAEGTVIEIVLGPEECAEAVRGAVALKYCLVGIWVCFDDCKNAHLARQLCDNIDADAREALWRFDLTSTSSAGPDSNVKPVHERMVFDPAVTCTFSSMIVGKRWTIKRRMVPLTSALDRTSQSSQGSGA